MRIAVNKTYKMLIGGAFVRSESNRTLEATDSQGKFVANYSRATRKDVRDAVKAARSAASGWSARTAYNRGQILYRLAEMLEARSAEFAQMETLGEKSTGLAIDRLLYYAGWADKYQQLLGSVNPVAMSYFNFSVPEPMGVVGVAANGGLVGLVSVVAPVICGGNTIVVLAPEKAPLSSCEFAEIVATSDVPSGVVNILTGTQAETVPHLAKHKDVNAIALCESSAAGAVVDDATDNLKRVRDYGRVEWQGVSGQGLDFVSDFQETKTVWHPMGV